MKWVIIGQGNCLTSVKSQGIWNMAFFLSIGHQGTNFSEILIKMKTYIHIYIFQENAFENETLKIQMTFSYAFFFSWTHFLFILISLKSVPSQTHHQQLMKVLPQKTSCYVSKSWFLEKISNFYTVHRIYQYFTKVNSPGIIKISPDNSLFRDPKKQIQENESFTQISIARH